MYVRSSIIICEKSEFFNLTLELKKFLNLFPLHKFIFPAKLSLQYFEEKKKREIDTIKLVFFHTKTQSIQGQKSF